MPSPLGRLLVVSSSAGLVALDFDEPELRLHPGRTYSPAVHAYFEGVFEPLAQAPIDPGGTPFQGRVWSALRQIPPGQTRSYGQLAAQLGKPEAARAVGLANALNPLNLAIPCHRLVGARGQLTGYAGGLHRKAWLLDHEARAQDG